MHSNKIYKYLYIKMHNYTLQNSYDFIYVFLFLKKEKAHAGFARTDLRML